MKMDNPLLSIIIPVYNGEAFIKDRIERLLRLDLKDTQIIVVDDGSSDRSSEICDTCLNNYANFKLITQSNQGPGGARNRGIKEADGEYIIFLDSDDILLNSGFQSLQTYLLDKKPDILMGKIVLINKLGKSILPTYEFPYSFSVDTAREFIFSKVPDNIWHSVRYIFKRMFLLKHNLFFRTKLICGEDMELSLRALSYAEKIDFLNEAFYGYYYARQGSITQTAVYKRILDINKIVVYSVNRYINEKYWQSLSYRLIMESFYGLSRYCICSRRQRAKLQPGIEKVIWVYHHSPSALVHLFLKTRRFIPLYIWSVILYTAKTIRGIFRNIVGPVSLKHIPGGK